MSKGNFKSKDKQRNNKNNFKERRDTSFEEREDIVFGRNAVMETVKSNTTIECLYITNGPKEGSINSILNLAKEKKLVVKASKFSKTAKEQIEKLGGKAEVI